MTCELAKQLKDAGFPMKPVGRDYMPPQYYEVETGITFALPTLSELIEACGFIDFVLWFVDDIWVAAKIKGGYVSIRQIDADVDDEHGEGLTPKEAVANLWLALNKHD